MTSARAVAKVKRSERASNSERMAVSDFENIGFLGGHGVIDLLDETVGELLDFLFVAVEVVLGEGAVLLRLFEAVDSFPTGGTHADTGFLGHLLDAFDKILAPFLGK